MVTSKRRLGIWSHYVGGNVDISKFFISCVFPSFLLKEVVLTVVNDSSYCRTATVSVAKILQKNCCSVNFAHWTWNISLAFGLTVTVLYAV
jgi:hypothetical protein